MTDIRLKIEKIIHAPIEKVFDAWLDPEMLAKFMIPMPGMPEPEVENDPRQGGRFTIVMRVGQDRLPHKGEYLQINRPNRLEFSWISHRCVDGSIVTIDFEKINENETNVCLTHVKFIDEEARDDHSVGWRNILDKLNDMMR